MTSPSAAAAADALRAAVFDELYLHTTRDHRAAERAGAIAAIAADARAVRVKTDRARSVATRRLVVDALRKAQRQSGFLALREARDAIDATRNGLGPSDRALTEDLVAQITAAISPYFE